MGGPQGSSHPRECHHPSPSKSLWNSQGNLSEQKVVVVQSLSGVWLIVTPWTAARRASLSFTISRSLLKLMSIGLVMSPNHLILCHPLIVLSLIFPSIKVFANDQFFTSRGQITGASASTTVLPVNIQGWFPLGLADLILLFKGLSKVFSSITIQKHQLFLQCSAFFMVQLIFILMFTISFKKHRI